MKLVVFLFLRVRGRHVPEGLDSSAAGTLSPYCFRHSRPASLGSIRVQYGFPRSGTPGTCTGALALSPWPSLWQARKETRVYQRGCRVLGRANWTSLWVVEIFLLLRSSPDVPLAPVHARPDRSPSPLARVELAVAVVTRHLERRGWRGQDVEGRESAEGRRGRARLTDGGKYAGGRAAGARGRTVTRPRVIEGIAAGRRLRLVRGYGRGHPRRTARRPVPLETLPPPSGDADSPLGS